MEKVSRKDISTVGISIRSHIQRIKYLIQQHDYRTAMDVAYHVKRQAAFYEELVTTFYYQEGE